MGLRTGGRRAKSLKNRVKSSKIELRFREIRSEGCSSRTSVQQALIYPQTVRLQPCFGRVVFVIAVFFAERGCAAASRPQTARRARCAMHRALICLLAALQFVEVVIGFDGLRGERVVLPPADEGGGAGNGRGRDLVQPMQGGKRSGEKRIKGF